MNNIEEAKKKLETMRTDFKEKLARMKKELTEEAEKMFKEGCKIIFEQFPDIESFSWTQYTCYWNDGDPCFFSANTDSWSLTIDETYMEDTHADVYSIKQDMKTHKNNAVIYKELEKQLEKAEAEEKRKNEQSEFITEVLGMFDKDDYLTMFGDHARVTVTQDDILVEEYTDHD